MKNRTISIEIPQISIDETKDKKGRHLAAVIARDLNDDKSQPYMIHTVDLPATNGETIRDAVDDAVRELGGEQQDVLVLVTDGPKYMLRGGS